MPLGPAGLPRASNFLILFSDFSPTPLARTAKISDAAKGREQRQGAGMRAVLIGLASAALLSGGTASAAPQFCPEARAVVKAIYDPGDGHSFGPPKRADLSGQEFRVVRAFQASSHRLVELSGKAGHFTIKEDNSPSWAVSWVSSAPGAPKITKPDRLSEIRIHDAYGLIVTDGPLSGYVMKVASCR